MSYELPKNNEAVPLNPGQYKTDLYNKKAIFALKNFSDTKKDKNYYFFNSYADAFFSKKRQKLKISI